MNKVGSVSIFKGNYNAGVQSGRLLRNHLTYIEWALALHICVVLLPYNNVIDLRVGATKGRGRQYYFQRR